ncbi:carbohydrate ABC transporter permease [Limnochorda pilosa]|uniref:Sugar ABC transporter permease n=1 Tax=Limnochorda pilosa TaxID=1555112 RepID=A0A0K2SGR4_LIMPI|nr:sugar ABC transporter permease [Limnochorda pilosa]BAS26280.1 sugar ABC transporter permease [Limnochorda pilosa]
MSETSAERQVIDAERQRALERQGNRRRMGGSEGGFAALLLGPTVAFLSIFGLFPLGRSVWMSLRSYKLSQPWTGFPFVGLQNYLRIFSDHAVMDAIRVTLVYVLVTVTFQVIFGLVIALLLHPPYRGRGVTRTLMLLPWTLSPVLAGVMWSWMFNSSHGVINDLLIRLGLVSLEQPILWLGDPDLALWSVMAAAVWGASSYCALLLLAGLQGIPDELYEAARIDGASGMRSFWTMTLPLLRPAVMVAVTLRTLGALQAFDLPYAMTGGGPGNATQTLPMYIHQYTFGFLDFGYGSALAVVLMLIGLTLAIVYVRALSSEEA